MANKKDNTIFWIIGIIILFLVLTQTNLFKKQETGMIGLTPHYYKDGVEIFPKKTFFSVVTPPGGSYDQIAFSISATNTGPPITLQVVDATPTAFKNSLPTTSTPLTVGQTKTLWTSGLIDTSQFESMAQPVRFWIKISGTDVSTGAMVYKEGYADLTFEPEALTTTQSFFGELFSVVDFGGITYHNDKISIKNNANPILLDYTGAGYYTGLNIMASGGIGQTLFCNVYIDGTKIVAVEAYQFNSCNDATCYTLNDNNIVRFENSFKVDCSGGNSISDWYGHISYMTD